MFSRISTFQARLLPNGPLDVVRQVVLFMAAYQLYRLTRGLVNDPQAATAAFQNARDLIHVEQALNIFIEPSLQTFASGQQWLLDGASWMYINAQTSITLGALAWLYMFRNDSFYFVRNMFLVAFGVALIGYAAFPTAPPRFFPEWGFFDAVSDFTGVRQDSVTINELFNPYAAVPVDARRVRAHDQRPDRAARTMARAEGLLVAVSAARRLRHRRHRQPLHRRRRARRLRSGHRRARRSRDGSRAAGRLEVPAGARLHSTATVTAP